MAKGKTPDKGKPKSTLYALEKRLMLDASLGATLAPTVTFTEAQVNILQAPNRDFDFATPTILSGAGEDGNVTLTGSTTNFDGAKLTISTSGGIYEQLYISRTRQTAGTMTAGDIAVYNFTVSYHTGTGSAIQIGSLDQADGNGVDGNPLIITLNSNATQAGIEALIERISFRTLSDNPAASRTITYSLKDSGGVELFSTPTAITLNITAQNDAPYVATNTGIRVTNGATVTIGRENLLVRDEDSATVTYTLSVLPTTALALCRTSRLARRRHAHGRYHKALQALRLAPRFILTSRHGTSARKS